MADIFISYAREDVETAKRLAAALGAHKWSVFWDRRIPAGRRFEEVISEQLAAARCVITLWSRAANASDWVQDEAERAKRRNILVPALIERVEPPLGFGPIQTADLVDWEGEGAHEGFQQLLQDIEQYVSARTPVGRKPSATESVEAPSTGFERERAEQERRRREKAEAERQAAEAERVARERAEKERLKRAQQEAAARANADRLAREKAEQERLERERAESRRLFADLFRRSGRPS